jgi:hypothetical protein
MENLFTWVAAQNSEQLASYILDIIINSYVGDVSKSARDNFFIIQAIKRDGNLTEQQEKAWKKLWDGWCKKWGVKWEKFPDYEKAIEILIGKYGDSFASIKIDGHENPLG